MVLPIIAGVVAVRGPVLFFYPETMTTPRAYDDPDEVEWVHLFVFPRRLANLPDAETSPRIIEGDQWVFAIWREGNTGYAIGLPAREGARERLLILGGA